MSISDWNYESRRSWSTPARASEQNGWPAGASTERLVSLDALRGFDMFWITGGAGVLAGLRKVIQRPVFDKFLEQFNHVPWEGLHFEDLVWPLFMFIMGGGDPAFRGQVTRAGHNRSQLLLHAVRRAVIMFCLGNDHPRKPSAL